MPSAIQVMNQFLHQEDYKIFAFAADPHHRASIPAMLRLLQQTAMAQVMALGISVFELSAQHLTWVLLRFRLEVSERPPLGAGVKVVTFPCGADPLMTYRYYFLYNDQEQLLAQAASTWLLMDTRSRKVVRIPPAISAIIPSSPPAGWSLLPPPAAKLPLPAEPATAHTFQVQWHDLDFNGHLNNVTYAQYFLESLPPTLLAKGEMCSLDLLFHREARWQEVLTAQSASPSADTYLHQLHRGSDGKLIAQGRSVWLPPTNPMESFY